MRRSDIERELREMIKRLIALPELNMDDLEFASIMHVKYAKILIEETSDRGLEPD